MVRIRCGQRSVIVAIGLRLHAAVSLAEQIAEILGAPASSTPVLTTRPPRRHHQRRRH
jgi:hypothetical protein